MSSKRIAFFCLLAAIAALGACREKTQGLAYVVGDRVPIFAKPDRFLQPLGSLPRDTRIEVLERKVPDPRAPERAFWYRVRTEKFEGFISYDEELLRQNLASFKSLEKHQSALVTAGGLNLRKDPHLSAAVVTVMPRRTLVDILEQGSLPQKIKKNEDYWVRVRTRDGKVGFCFAAHLYRGEPEEIRELARAEFETLQGYVFAQAAEPAYLIKPGGRAVTSDDPVNGGYHDLSKYPRAEGDGTRYAAVTARMKHDGVLWYHVEETICHFTECTGLNAWVSSAEVEFLPSLFEHSLARAEGKPDAKLLREVQASLDEGEELHAAKTTYKEIHLIQSKATEQAESAADAESPAGATGGALPIATVSATGPALPLRHYLVQAAVGANALQRTIIVARSGERLRTLGSFEYPKLRDLDGDGRMELIADESERADTTYSIYTYLGPEQGFRKILHFSLFDSNVEFADPYIYFKNFDPANFENVPPFQKQYARAEERFLLLENGAYREVPPAAVPPEARQKINRD